MSRWVGFTALALLLALAVAPASADPLAEPAACPFLMRWNWGKLCEAASAGNRDALLVLGIWRLYGINGKAERPEGERLLLEAAVRGQGRAYYVLGIARERRDPSAAHAAYERAAASGCVGARIALLRLDLGEGWIEDDAELDRRVAAVTGDPGVRHRDLRQLADVLSQLGRRGMAEPVALLGAGRFEAETQTIARAMLLASSRKMDAAVALLEAARDERDGEPAATWEFEEALGHLRLRQGRPEAARAHFEAALAGLRRAPCSTATFDAMNELEIAERLARE